MKCHHRVEGGMLSCCKLQQSYIHSTTAQVTEAGGWLPSTTPIFPVVTCPVPLDSQPHLPTTSVQHAGNVWCSMLQPSPLTLTLTLLQRCLDQIKYYSYPLSLEEEKHQDYQYPSKWLWQFPAIPWPRAGSVHCPMEVGALSVFCSSGENLCEDRE